MPRRGTVKKRKPQPDHFYNSTLISVFVNTILKKGKKSLAQKIVYTAMERVKQKSKEDPLKMFEKAAENRSTSLAVRWLIRYARDRAGKSMEEKLAAEIIDAVNNRGGAVKKKEDIHKMAESNRAFAHYRW
jgi:small subunit ribosomal protein S7